MLAARNETVDEDGNIVPLFAKGRIGNLERRIEFKRVERF